jgi:hypothetical protein
LYMPAAVARSIGRGLTHGRGRRTLGLEA